jgi:pyridoxamine 5'-phosphate oxidase
MDLGTLRQEYARESLTESDVERDPFRQFAKWFAQAQQAGMVEPNAMTLATASRDGKPSARMVLLKGFDADGFTFYTDYRSRKGDDLVKNSRAALCFWWDALQRQVRIEGRVKKVAAEESAAYFASRPHGSKVGAWASHQSSGLGSRDALEKVVAQLSEKYPEGSDVPLPPHWGGFRVAPDVIEFWQGRPSRLHDRIVYTRLRDIGWNISRLSP